MFKQYTAIVGFIVIIGMIGGMFAGEVEASASFDSSKQNTKVIQHETPQYEQQSWNNFIEQFFAKQVGNTQYNHEQGYQEKVEQETKAEDEKVEEKKEDGNKSEQEEQKDSELHPFEQEVVELTNDERTKQGLQPLKLDTDLSVVARDKSKDMLNNQYFAHDSPTYGSPFDMMEEYGIDYRTAGENIAKGQHTAEEVVNGWMNSPGHRENILSNDFTHIGVGFIEEENIWTQQFIGK